MIKIKVAALIITLLLLASCQKQSEVGQYVYVIGPSDCYYGSIIHIDRDCAALVGENAKTKEERIVYSKVAFVDTCTLTRFGYEYGLTFCPRCVDDKAYEQLSAIINRNEGK